MLETTFRMKGWLSISFEKVTRCNKNNFGLLMALQLPFFFPTKVDVQDDYHTKSLSNMPQAEISFVFFCVCSWIDQWKVCADCGKWLAHLHKTQRWWSQDLNPARTASRQIALPIPLYSPTKDGFYSGLNNREVCFSLVYHSSLAVILQSLFFSSFALTFLRVFLSAYSWSWIRTIWISSQQIGKEHREQQTNVSKHRS